MPQINNCPGTLAKGYHTYSTTCLRRVFDGRKVDHILPYNSPATDEATDELYEENRKRISISGVQEKFSVVLDKNKIRLVNEGERGTHILKPIPRVGKNPVQMPANEHLTMQIARQVFEIETAENALIFFKNGDPAYITKRFDVKEDGSKLASEDFASMAGLTPQTHGENYKYRGNYLDLFEVLKTYLPVYQIEAPKLLKLIGFNYIFSNGDAHYKNFSILETPQGDYRLSPAYDLLNTRVHIKGADFALEDGLLPRNMSKGKVLDQFKILADQADIPAKQTEQIIEDLSSNSEMVNTLIHNSFLSAQARRNFLQVYQRKVKKFMS